MIVPAPSVDELQAHAHGRVVVPAREVAAAGANLRRKKE